MILKMDFKNSSAYIYRFYETFHVFPFQKSLRRCTPIEVGGKKLVFQKILMSYRRNYCPSLWQCSQWFLRLSSIREKRIKKEARRMQERHVGKCKILRSNLPVFLFNFLLQAHDANSRTNGGRSDMRGARGREFGSEGRPEKAKRGHGRHHRAPEKPVLPLYPLHIPKEVSSEVLSHGGCSEVRVTSVWDLAFGHLRPLSTWH